MTKPRLLLAFGLSTILIGSCAPGEEEETGGIPGFGISCSAQSECSSHALICDGTVCVQCTEEEDCRPSEDCKGGRCVGSIDCSTDDDCPRPLLCDPNSEVCVECIDDRDCSSDASCIAARCLLDNGMSATGNAGNGGDSAGGSSSNGGSGGDTETGGTDSGGTGGTSQGGQGSGGQAAGGADNGGAGGASGGSGGATGGGGSGGSGGSDPGPQYCDDKNQLAIPYNLQDDYVPYLYVADYADVSLDDQTICDGEAAPDATIFGCSAWEYSAATGDYGGVVWSYPLNDYAVAMPGLCVDSDASIVEFYVRGEVGGEQISFGAGGGPRLLVTLTSGWTKHTVDLPSPPNTNIPGGVKEGFVWSAEAGDNPDGLRFYVGNITMK